MCPIRSTRTTSAAPRAATMCELTLEAAGIDRDKEEWRSLARMTRKTARKAMKAARIARDAGMLMESASYFRSALRARQWANEWMREAK